MGSLIHSAHTGIAIFAGSIIDGEIYNDGQIKATGNGIFIGDGSLTITGTISNAGTIDVPLAGIEIANVPSFNAALQNGGTISAQTGLLVQDVSTFADNIDNELGAVVSAGYTGVHINAVSTFTEDIYNNGTISAGYTGLWLTAISSFIGAVSNSGTIVAGSLWFGGGIDFQFCRRDNQYRDALGRLSWCGHRPYLL